MTTDLTTLSGTERAAILVIALGVDDASAFLPRLEDAEIEAISVEVAKLNHVPAETVAAVLEAYHQAAMQPAAPRAAGGLDTARALLQGLGETRADTIQPRVEAATRGTGFDLAPTIPPQDLAAFLAGEHAQAAAVVLSRMDAKPAAAVLKWLPDAMRSDVIRRLSTLTPPPASALHELDAALRSHFRQSTSSSPDGVRRAADILTQAGTESGRQVLTHLSVDEPDLAGRIEGMLFVFEDLGRISARELGQIVAELDTSALALAMHGVAEPLAESVFGCVSERVAAVLREEMEMVPNPAADDVEEARLTVIETALRLSAAGAVSLDTSAAAEAVSA